MTWTVCPLAVDYGNLADLGGVLVAAVAAWTVWRLGRRTNDLAEASRRVAVEASDRDDREKTAAAQRIADERRLLLMFLASEVVFNAGNLDDMIAHVTQHTFAPRYLNDVATRLSLSENCRHIAFRNAEAKFDRLHVIGSPGAAQIVRAMGVMSTLQVGLQQAAAEANGLTDLPAQMVEMLKIALPAVRKDLAAVHELIQASVRESGMADSAVALAASAVEEAQQHVNEPPRAAAARPGAPGPSA